jgi:tRNA A-37 threonylcarbamoyl transferase component Bud32
VIKPGAGENLTAPISLGGRYELLRLLATGGMAEIYLARQNAMAGFEKEVVIKRLKPELARDPRLVEMFLDEARIGALLNHPNIVHVYDVEEHEGVPYIAMEYIVGEELVDLCRRGLELGKFLPLEHAVELIRQAAAGMGYFHAKRAPTASRLEGQPLEIVHCDISPTNLLVTEDGFLKTIDFGIARARGQRFREEGIFPGKLSYMSPEQALRERVDARSDIFSLGIVLYEITVGKRLFKGPAQDVLKRLTSGITEPPTFVRRDFPGALETIVMRALERHPSDRYQSAYDLADDLEEFLRDAKLHSGPVRIARYLDELAEAGGGQRRAELVSEHERGPRAEELEFDREVFAGYEPAAEGSIAAPPSEWDEFDERDEDVAAALGLDLEQLKLMRTPVPHHPEMGGDGTDGDRGGGGGGGAPPTLHRQAERAASKMPLRAPDSRPTIPARPPTAPPPAAALVPHPSAAAAPSIQGPPPDAVPYVVLGALALAIVGAILYFLL